MKHSSIRILLALVAQFNMKLVQMDVKTAFLHGDFGGGNLYNSASWFQSCWKENWICKLNKSLYGLKQGVRNKRSG